MKKGRGRPVVGKTWGSRRATAEDVQRYDAQLDLVQQAPYTRSEVRGGKVYRVRSLPPTGGAS